MKINSHTFLEKFFKLSSQIDIKGLKEHSNKLINTNSILYRQVCILLEVFGLKDFKSFLNADFIYNYDESNFSELLNTIYSTNIIQLETYSMVVDDMTTIDVLFTELVDYRIHLQIILEIPNEILSANGLLKVPVQIFKNINDSINNHVILIDNLLANIISPQNKTFDIQDLILNYSYPVK